MSRLSDKDVETIRKEMQKFHNPRWVQALFHGKLSRGNLPKMPGYNTVTDNSAK